MNPFSPCLITVTLFATATALFSWQKDTVCARLSSPSLLAYAHSHLCNFIATLFLFDEFGFGQVYMYAFSPPLFHSIPFRFCIKNALDSTTVLYKVLL